jgi:hypothetical protein
LLLLLLLLLLMVVVMVRMEDTIMDEERMALQLIETWMVLIGSWIRMASNRVPSLVVERQSSSSTGGQ